MLELRVVIANDDQSLRFIFLMPCPQRGDHALAVNSAVCPHVY
jgi:hypothetical protein